jgi:uncharacterized protein involved in exopolysaccharide biosynthesis
MNTSQTSRHSLRNLFHFLFKRKFEIIIIFLISVSVGSFGAILLKPVYEAQAQILVKIGRESVYVPATENLDPVVNYDRREQINSEIEILKSRLLAQKTIAKIGPSNIYKGLKNENQSLWMHIKKIIQMNDEPLVNGNKDRELNAALLLFQKNIIIEEASRSNLINVKFTHEDPDMSAKVINKMASIYLDHHLDVHKPQQTNDFFRQQFEFQKQKMQKTEAKLENLKRENNITSLNDQREILLRQTAEKRVEVDRTLSQEAETKYRIAGLREQLSSTPETIAQEKTDVHNPYLISNLQARLVELEINEKQLLNKYKESSRLVQNVREEIKLVREKLYEHEIKQYGTTRFGINPTYQRLKDELLRNQSELKSIVARRRTLNNQLKDYQKDLEKLNQIVVYHNQLQQELEMDQQNYQLYLTKFEESRISEAMDKEKISNVSLVEPAQPPLEPKGFRKRFLILIGIFLGVFGGLGFAIFMEYLDDTLELPEDVENYLKTPVLTTIPKLKIKTKKDRLMINSNTR